MPNARITSAWMRNMRVSDKFMNDASEEVHDEFARNMGHSTAVQRAHYLRPMPKAKVA